MEAVGRQVTQAAATFDRSVYASHIADFGFAIVESAISQGEVDCLKSAIQSLDDGKAIRKKRGVYGVRNLLDVCSAVRRLAASHAIRRFVTPVLGDDCFAVRAVYFDKIADANWSLGWHQDSVIAVQSRLDAPGFVGWSNKAGVWQVQPPAEVLARMLAIRVQLDDCPADNGPLRVLPGSHSHGWLDDEIDSWKSNTPAIVCEVQASDVIAMRPLLLHASAKSERAQHRRVIHIEFVADELPGDLDWHDRVHDLAE